ncbi:exonuclease SbcCD subunit D [Spirochaetota bacterium]
MKIAITSDIHISPEHPERLVHFESFIRDLHQKKIMQVIIAGDLFDKDRLNASLRDISRIISSFPDITIYVIPGNHDPSVHSKYFTSMDNLNVFSDPEVIELGGIQFFFSPYRESSMGEAIEQYGEALHRGKWVLVSHGDVVGAARDATGNEGKSYFPLAASDIAKYAPACVFLGHIHEQRIIRDMIYYPGSLYPVSVDERGPRKYIIYDTGTYTCSIEQHTTDVVYFREHVTVIPFEHMNEHLVHSLKAVRKDWEKQGIGKENMRSVKASIDLRGYTDDKERISAIIRKWQERIGLHDLEVNDHMNIAHMSELEGITSDFIKEVYSTTIKGSQDYLPDAESVIEGGLEILYS